MGTLNTGSRPPGGAEGQEEAQERQEAGGTQGAASLRSESTLQGVYSQAEEDLKTGVTSPAGTAEKSVHRWSLTVHENRGGEQCPREGGSQMRVHIHVSAGP